VKIKVDHDKTGIYKNLKVWRDKKYNEIDKEYKRRYAELETRTSAINKKITKTANVIRQLLEEGDISVDELRDIQRTVVNLNNQIDELLNNEFELVGTNIQLGNLSFFVKSKITCDNTELYALECERSIPGYDGQCPKCEQNHVELAPNRGMYAVTKVIHDQLMK